MNYIVQIEEDSILLESMDRKRLFYNNEITNYNIYVKTFPEVFSEYFGDDTTFKPSNYDYLSDIGVGTLYSGLDYPLDYNGNDGDKYSLIGSNFITSFIDFIITPIKTDEFLYFSNSDVVGLENAGSVFPLEDLELFQLNLETKELKISFNDNESKLNTNISINSSLYELNNYNDNYFSITNSKLYTEILSTYRIYGKIKLTTLVQEERESNTYIKVDGKWIIDKFVSSNPSLVENSSIIKNMVQISETDYINLPIKDNDTLYVIKK